MWANIYAVFLVVVSFITFCVYAADKKKAKKGAWRVPEKTLLCLSFFGGAAGGLLAMAWARHKTKHWYFLVVNGIGLIWQASLWLFLIVKGL
jgi:uncharacterized membrane protein YsdA (DUF1294 family)